MLSDTQLKDLGYRIKKRDREAFHVLYRERFEPLQRYAMRYVYDWQQAEDLVQDAFVSLLLNLHKYDETRDIFTYLFVLVKNGCLNYNRKLQIMDSHSDKVVEALLFSQMEDTGIDPDIKQRLHKVLSTISEKQRDVLIRHIVERRKVHEIADELNISQTTVNTHLKRGMRKLRQSLMAIIFGF